MIGRMLSVMILPGLRAGVAGAVSDEPPATCNSPVYMVVQGVTHDKERMAQYARAIAESGIYERLGGYYLTVPRPIEVFEGELPKDYVNLVVRFPCIENARAFWNSKIYQEEIIPLRQNPSAGDYIVSIYAEAPLRTDMIGRVGEAGYKANFSDPQVPQIAPPIVGPGSEKEKP